MLFHATENVFFSFLKASKDGMFREYQSVGINLGQSNILWYGKILNTKCLPKRPTQTVQTQIRLHKSDQGLCCLLFDKFFVNSSPDNHII